MSGSLSGNRAISGVISQEESYCIMVASIQGVLRRRRGRRPGDTRGEGHVRREQSLEREVYPPMNAQGCREPPEAGRGRHGLSLGVRRDQPCDTSASDVRTNSIVSGPQVVVLRSENHLTGNIHAGLCGSKTEASTVSNPETWCVSAARSP